MTPTERVSALETLLERIRRNAAEPRPPRAGLPSNVTATWVARPEARPVAEVLPGSIAVPGERDDVEPPTFDPARALGGEEARAEDSQREPDEPATLVRENNAPRVEAAADAEEDEGLEVDFDDVEIVEDPTLDVTSAAVAASGALGQVGNGAAALRAHEESLEAERLEQDRLEAERLEAERLEAGRLEAERMEATRLAAEEAEAERVAREETQRLVAEAARERARAEDEERRAREELEEAERFEAELVAREQRRAAEMARSMPPRAEPEIDRIEAERIRREQAERADAAVRARTREEATRRAIEEAERRAVELAEADLRARAEAAAARREEAERLEAERVAREEGERLLAEQAARLAEEERVEAERLEAERIETQRAEEQRLDAERAEEQRLDAERAETDRLAAELEAQSLAVTAERASAHTLAEASAEASNEQPEQSGVVEATPISSRQPRQDDYRSIDDGFGEMLDADEPPPESGEVQSQRKPTIHEEPTLVAALDDWSAQASAPGGAGEASVDEAPPFAEISRAPTRPPERGAEARRPDSAPPLRSLPQEVQGDVIRRPPISGEPASFVGAVSGREAATFGDLLDASLSLAPR